ncbi:DNA-directed RNA polymerase III, subunit Rpc31 [Mycena sp. CBHHK59/15]|nr:DNA-directed RNA polymerase III, subunit Rpc31 [Mycena sp. CBHHK59/15]
MGGRGRGGFGRGRGAFVALPMGLTHADIQSMSREATAMYPSMIPPVLTDISVDEARIAAYQIGFAQRMRKSAYYVVETTKSTATNTARPSRASRRSKKGPLRAVFPPDIFEGYFNPKRKRKPDAKPTLIKKRMNIDDIDEDEEKVNNSFGTGHTLRGLDAGSAPASDYDVDEEYDNDYAENYFDNGEADDNDDLGGGGGGGDDGGGGDYE